MKPDWQNKSFAKSGSATGSTTMHSKLKVGMSSLHSKIGAANSNMPKAPKPAVRKFADGGSVNTRSDEEIGDTNLRTGVVDQGSYDRRQKAGAENMARLSSAVDSLKSFFSQSDKASSSNVTGESGMSAADEAKKAAMSGGAQMPTATEESRRQLSDYMAKAPASETPATESATETVAPKKSAPARKTSVEKSPASTPEVKMTGSPSIPSSEVKSTPVASPKPAAPAGKTYRTLEGKMARATPEVEKPLDQQWGLHNVVPNAKYYAGQVAKAAGSVAEAVKNYETPAERRARLAKEGK